MKHENIPHVKQRFNWDCGIACVLMLLSEEQRSYFQKHFFQICHEEGFGTNTWTIDLCYLLKRFQINHRMYTTRLAANCKAGTMITVKDANRVRDRFANASVHGIVVVEGDFRTEELGQHVWGSGPALVLVDESLLSCDLCKHNKLSSEIRRVFGGRYRGHYVLVVGVAGQVGGGRKLLYRDPARAHSVCVASPRRLHAARLAAHTDRDVILIDNKL